MRAPAYDDNTRERSANGQENRMSPVTRTVVTRLALFATAVTTAVGAASVAQAADLYYGQGSYGPQPGYYGPPPPPPPAPKYEQPCCAPPVVYRPVEEGPCRITYRRRIDPYGRETVHRVRVCDEGPVYYEPGWARPAVPYSYQYTYDDAAPYTELRPPAPVPYGY
jgi:hypothetical protein